jgi:hypothetical protein
VPQGQSFAFYQGGLLGLLLCFFPVGLIASFISILAVVQAVIPSYLKQRDGQHAPPLVEVNQAILARFRNYASVRKRSKNYA